MKRYLIIAGLLLITSYAFSQSPKPTCTYKVVVSKAYFYDYDKNVTSSGIDTGQVILPNWRKKKQYLIYGDIVTFNCRDFDNPFINVRYKNKKGKITEGYLQKKSLEQIPDEN